MPPPEKPKKTPPKGKPWDRPQQPPAKGDNDPNSIYVNVGLALSLWEGTEEHLGQLFALFIGLNEPSFAAVRAFGAIATSRGRIDMLTAAAEAYFLDHPYPSLQKSFSDALAEASGFAARRNEIAHGTVRGRRAVNGAAEFFLQSAAYNTAKMKTGIGSVYAFTSNEIIHYAVQFFGVYERLDFIYWWLAAHIAARESYGETLGPEHLEALDHLLLNPTAPIRTPPPESLRA